MPTYKIYETDSFKKHYDKADQNEKNWIDQTHRNVEEDPSGKILHFSWFREKKYLNKRLYYLIEEEQKKILFLTYAPKKEQKEIINFVLKNMKELLNYLRSLR